MKAMRAFLFAFVVSCSDGPSITVSPTVVIDRMSKLSDADKPTPTPAPFMSERANSLVPAGSLSTKPLSYDLDGIRAAADASSIDLRAADTSVKDQGQRGTCTAFGMWAVVENLLKKTSGKEYDLSEEHLWSEYATPQMEPAIQAAQSRFFVTEADYPYNPRRAYRKHVPDNKGAVKVGKVDEIEPTVSAILDTVKGGTPIYFAFDVSQAFMQPDETGVVDPFDRSVVGGHAIEIAGVVQDPKLANVGGGYFILKNSWSKQYGDKGYSYLPFVYCKTHTCYQAFKVDSKSLQVR